MVAALLVASCTAPTPVADPSPSALMPDPSAFRGGLDARFGALGPGPTYPGSVWSVDQPVTLEPRAFGTFPPDRQPGGVVTFDRVRLDAALPSVPSDVAVALVGSYDETWSATVSRFVGNSQAWRVVPLYAEIVSLTSLGTMPTPSAGGLEAARAVLQGYGLLPPDMEPHPHAGVGRFEFIRRLDGLAIWTNNGVSLRGLADGGSQVLARRRPILAISRYPLRSPGEAWAQLQAGQGRTMYVDDGAPPQPVYLSEFVVASVELVYLELQVVGPRELMQPYYAFLERGGSVLYISAVGF